MFLHGWGGNETSFANILPFFRCHYRCLTLSMPMFQKEGYADKPWTLDDYAGFVTQFLDNNKVEYCHIIAHSFGCRVATLLATQNPSRYGQLVFTGAAGIRYRKRVNSIKIWFYKLRKKLFKTTKGGSSDYRNLSQVGKITFQNIINRDLSPDIAKIQNPTLLIFGHYDKSTPLKIGRKWQKLVKNSELRVYKNSGHFCYIDEAERFIADAYGHFPK